MRGGALCCSKRQAPLGNSDPGSICSYCLQHQLPLNLKIQAPCSLVPTMLFSINSEIQAPSARTACSTSLPHFERQI